MANLLFLRQTLCNARASYLLTFHNVYNIIVAQRDRRASCMTCHTVRLIHAHYVIAIWYIHDTKSLIRILTLYRHTCLVVFMNELHCHLSMPYCHTMYESPSSVEDTCRHYVVACSEACDFTGKALDDRVSARVLSKQYHSLMSINE